MGVNGLWTVVQPCARPTNLATLNRKRLAVDASIWIYQFLKAVRDKEGNALRNSHVVGFFRRICKLLWFGIKPVFVFDGGAPALKRQTIAGRRRRREGRREDAVRTAGKLLAVQMQRVAEEEESKRRRRREMEESGASRAVEEPAEEIPDVSQLVYVDELGMSNAERQKSRKFYKQDAYHLPELENGIAAMGKPDDPRIMSIEELEDYAKQFQSGEDINLYDFSKIAFEGEFFKSLPPADRYNILNAARVRSRLRMGLSKEQLDDMFPDRMAFSRFQIERARERNRLTQRLMKEIGMTGIDLTQGINAPIAGDSRREYILVKNDGADGGWALGVVSKERDIGEFHKPIDVDALQFQYQTKDEVEEDLEDDEDFEDVPIEGVNRLPKAQPRYVGDDLQAQARNRYDTAALGNRENVVFMEDDEDSMFVGGEPAQSVDDLFDANTLGDEDEDLNRAIAMSLKSQHGADAEAPEDEDEEAEFEDVTAPEWTQKATEPAKPVMATTGSMIAHIVNNRANAAVPKRRTSNASSGSDVDLRTALSKKKKKGPAPKKVEPAKPVPNVKNSFGGPLPFEKLDWKSSIFGKKPEKQSTQAAKEEAAELEPDSDEDMAGGFEREDQDDDAPRPLPPWMTQDESDIRDSMKKQRERDRLINEEDAQAAFDEEQRMNKDVVIQIDSDDDDDSDVEIIDAPVPTVPQAAREKTPVPVVETTVAPTMSLATLTKVDPPVPTGGASQASVRDAESAQVSFEGGAEVTTGDMEPTAPPAASPSPEPEFEDVEVEPPTAEVTDGGGSQEEMVEPILEPPEEEELFLQVEDNVGEEGLFVPDDYEGNDEFSDPEDEELLAQMAEEAEEHARFASQLNNKSEKENQEAYERELRALRTQQKKDRRDADEVTQVMVTECQALLRLFGIPYITAPMEAEAQCAELVRIGLVDGIVTDDSDTFLFGGTRVYKNMFNSNKFVELYLSADLEKELSLSREQLIAIAQLLGSDYTEGLPGVGPVTAIEILSEFPGREGLTEFRDWWQDVQLQSRPKEADSMSTFRKKFRKSQGTKLFLPTGFPSSAVFDAYLKPEVDGAAEHFQWGVPDVEGLRQFLMATIGWSQERTDEVLVPVIRDMNRREAEGTQSNITRFFEGAVGTGAKEAFAPKERGKSSKRMTEAVNKLRANAVIDSISASQEKDAVQTPASKRKRTGRNSVVLDADDEGDGDDVSREVDHDESVQESRPRKGKGKKAKASS